MNVFVAIISLLYDKNVILNAELGTSDFVACHPYQHRFISIRHTTDLHYT